MSGGANKVTLTFAGDSRALDKASASVVKDMDNVGAHAKTLTKGLHEQATGFGQFNEKVEGSTKSFRGSADLVDGLTSSLSTFGINVPGQQVIGLARGMADLADGFSTVAGPAIEKVAVKLGFMTAATEAETAATGEAAAAQKGLNLAMIASPIGIMIAAAAALGVGLYFLWNKSETFRNGVKALGRDAKIVFDGMVTAVSAVGSGIKRAFEGAFNFIADAWNNTVGQLSFHIPSWIPGIGGDGFSVPKIPHFATGGSFNGLAVVGEAGPELIAGSGNVVPMSRAGVGSGQQQIHVDFTGVSTDALVEALRRGIRVRGGDVQAVLGSNF